MTPVVRQFVLPWLLLALWLPQPAAAGAVVPPLEVVRGTANQVIHILETRREELRQHPERLFALINEVVVPHFDFRRMARWVLGKYWRRASEEERERFVTEFRRLLVRTYGTALLEYTGEPIRYLPVKAPPGARDVTVRSEVVQNDGQPVVINYRMHLGDDGWKVYDVTVDGISLVTNYRSGFAAEIRANGLSALIDKLARRNDQEEGLGE